MQFAEFMLSNGQRKVAINPLAVLRIEEVNNTTTNIIQHVAGGQTGFVSVQGSYMEVKSALNVSL